MSQSSAPARVRFSSVGRSHTPSDSDTIEQAQRRFLSGVGHVLNILHPSHDHSSVLHELGLTTLADRRVDNNIMFLRNLISGAADAPSFLTPKVGK